MTEPIVGDLFGYRVFRVDFDQLLSIGAAPEYAWAPGTNRARCTKPRSSTVKVWVNDPTGAGLKRVPEHTAHGPIPGRHCRCGFYLLRSEWIARREVGDFVEDDEFVMGRVGFAGRAIEHELGYRAEYARVVALVTHNPYWNAAAIERYGLDVEAPRTKAEEGYATGLVRRVEGRRVSMQGPEFDGVTILDWSPAVEIPAPGSYGTVFRPDGRLVEGFEHEPDEEGWA